MKTSARVKQQVQTATYKSVVVIDDNNIDCYIAERSMKKYRFAEEVILIQSAREALEYLIHLADTPSLLPDIIFLDIRMPEMDGFDFLVEFGQLPSAIQVHCPIVILSSSAHKDDKERALSFGFVISYLNKPLDQEELSKMTGLEKQVSPV